MLYNAIKYLSKEITVPLSWRQNLVRHASGQKSESTIDKETKSAATSKPESTIDKETKSAATSKPESTTTVETKSAAKSKPESTTTVETKSAAKSKPESTTTVETKSAAKSKPESVTAKEAKSTANQNPGNPLRTQLEVTGLVRSRIKYPHCRVSIIGLGGVGKSLAHLLKMYPGGLTELRLCSRSSPEGIVEELSHIPTKVSILGFKGENRLADGLEGADIVIMTAGASRGKGIETREQLFTANAVVCADIINFCADKCPGAMIAIITNPLDSLVPIAAEVLKQRGVYNPNKLFGVCQLDEMRSARFYAELIGAEPKRAYVPVVGGHSDTTMVPLFSKAKPYIQITPDETKQLIDTIRTAGKRVVDAKKGSGGSTYSMASAAMYFVHKLCRAIHHQPHVVVSAYVPSKVSRAGYFCNELLLGPNGIEDNLGYGKISPDEEKLVEAATASLEERVKEANTFIQNNASTLFAKK